MHAIVACNNCTLGVCGVVRVVLDRPPPVAYPSDQKPRATPALDRTPIERLDIVNTLVATDEGRCGLHGEASRIRGPPFPAGRRRAPPLAGRRPATPSSRAEGPLPFPFLPPYALICWPKARSARAES